MRSLFVLAFTVLGVGAQEVPPNPAPPTAAREGRIITKLDDQKKSDKTHQADSKSLPEAPCNQCLNHCSVGQPHVKTKEEQAKEDSLDLLSRRSMRAAIIGVFGGLVGIAILVWQTILTRTAANAAKVSADALINSERAWIMVDIDPVPGLGGGRMLGGMENETHTQVTSAQFRITCRNEGKTPAWITEKRACLKIMNGSPPVNPDLNSTKVIQYEPEPLAVGKETRRDGSLTYEGWENLGQITIIYGVIKYRDVFADSRSTVFGYVLTVDNRFERLTGLPEYNKNT
jgi:hypothetical protein